MSSDKLSQHLHKIILVGLYLALLMPFIYVDNLIFPFITGKIFVFQILIEIIFATYLLLIYVDKNYRPRKTVLLILVTLFILNWILSSIFGVDFDRSFWGNYERMSGAFTMIHFFLYFLVLTNVLKDKRSWHKYLFFAVMLSGAQALIGITQYFSKNLFLTAGGGRIWGTLGNYIYLATYSIFHIFLGAYLFFETRTSPVFKKAKKLQQYSLLTLMLLNFIALYLSGTRGGYLGFLIGFFVAFAIVLLGVRNKKFKQFLFFGFCAMLVIGVLSYIFREKPFIKNIPLLGPIVNINISSGTESTRLIGWNIAIQGWKERPILGWGPENYYYVFNKYYDPRSLEHGYYETWFDRPHNAVLDLLSTQGVIGLTIYLTIFLSVLIILTKRYRKGAIDIWALAIPVGGLGAYFVQNLFVFDQPSSFILFYLFLAWFNFLSINNQDENNIAVDPNNKKIDKTGMQFWYMATFLCIAVLGLLYKGTIEPWRAGVINIKAERLLLSDFEVGYKTYKEALTFNTPYKDDVQLAFARVIHDRSQASTEFLNQHKEKVLFTSRELEDHAKKHPNDVYSYMTLAQVYVVLAGADPSYFKLANEAMEKAAEMSPKRQQVYYVWARIKVLERKFDEALALIQKTIDFDPNVGESYWYMGITEHLAGNKDGAVNYLEQARDHRYTWKSIGEILFVVNLENELGRFDKTPPLLEDAISMSPTQAELYIMLANAYKQVNEIEKAQRALGKAIELNPSLFDKLKPPSN